MRSRIAFPLLLILVSACSTDPDVSSVSGDAAVEVGDGTADTTIADAGDAYVDSASDLGTDVPTDSVTEVALADAGGVDGDAATDAESEVSPDAVADLGVVSDAATPDTAVDSAPEATLDASTDATSDVGVEAAIDAASDIGLDVAIDAAIDVLADGGAEAATGWVFVRIGDCTGTDQPIGYSTGSDVPVLGDCNAADNGVAAVCWDQTTYLNSEVPGSAPGCTYKTVQATSCSGGIHPGYLYVCVAP